MTESSQEVLQKPLEGFETSPRNESPGPKELKENEFYFYPGTMIWPERTRQGAIQNESGVIATRLPQGKIKGLSGFRLNQDARLYYGRFWIVQEGGRFGAYTRQAHKKPYETPIRK